MLRLDDYPSKCCIAEGNQEDNSTGRRKQPRPSPRNAIFHTALVNIPGWPKLQLCIVCRVKRMTCRLKFDRGSSVVHSSRCFGYVKDWVEKKVRRHLMRARKRKGCGWDRWSSQWIYQNLGLFSEYQIRYNIETKALPVR